MDEVAVAGHILAFDGRVLEIFGHLGSSNGALRWHVGDLAVSVGGPDRKGRYAVEFKLASSHVARLLQIQGDEWPACEPFLRRVQEAVEEGPSAGNFT